MTWLRGILLASERSSLKQRVSIQAVSILFFWK